MPFMVFVSFVDMTDFVEKWKMAFLLWYQSSKFSSRLCASLMISMALLTLQSLLGWLTRSFASARRRGRGSARRLRLDESMLDEPLLLEPRP